ncbi:MAG: hypothetical protein ACI9MR_001467 [Myxococcota bacterium]|jgi:hypothetical protein
MRRLSPFAAYCDDSRTANSIDLFLSRPQVVYTHYMSKHPAVMTRGELATFLSLDDATVGRLVEETALPRFSIGGGLRFSRDHVAAWLGEHDGEVLPPAPRISTAPAPPAPQSLGSASSDEHPWVSAEAVEALGHRTTDAAANMERLTLRDALLELNDELLPVMSRASHGRLNIFADEKSRTTPWRLDDGAGHIGRMAIAWADGPSRVPQFADQTRIEVELTLGELRLALYLVGANRVGLDTPLRAANQAGFAVEIDDHGTPRTVAKVYPLATPAPTLGTVSAALAQDLSVLLPVWSAAH